MIKKIVFIYFFCVVLSAQASSVFGAGNLNSSSPYGLTKSEKEILKQNKKIKFLLKKQKSLEYKLKSLDLDNVELNQKLEGFESVYESDSKTLNRAKKKILNMKNTIEANKVNISVNLKKIESFEIKITNLENKIINNSLKLDKFIKFQKENNVIVEKSLKSINQLLNEINAQYVSKKQFDELVKFVNKKKTIKQKTKKTKKIKRSNKELYKYAKSLYKKNYLTKSIPYFKELLNRRYKPAEINFYMAEINFYKKYYKNAIHYYKASMMIYDQAKYIPQLLLHSAISFEKIKDKDNAINFYGTLVDAYPQTKEAVEAQKRLSILNQ